MNGGLRTHGFGVAVIATFGLLTSAPAAAAASVPGAVTRAPIKTRISHASGPVPGSVGVVRGSATREPLKIQISRASGTVLGAVTISYNHRTCSGASCSYGIPVGTRVVLGETAKHPATWTFSKWVLNGQAWGSARTATFKMPAYRVVAQAIFVRAQVSVYSRLIGTWLGPGLGDAGGCGKEYGQFTFFANQGYSYTENSELCGGITNAGNYWIQNGSMFLHWTQCNYPCSPGTSSSRFGFIAANAFELCDTSGCYDYYRQ